MVRCREAPDFAGTADFAGITKSSEKLRQFRAQRLALNVDYVHLDRVGTKTNSAITTSLKDRGTKFPPMCDNRPCIWISRKYGIVARIFRGCETC